MLLTIFYTLSNIIPQDFNILYPFGYIFNKFLNFIPKGCNISKNAFQHGCKKLTSRFCLTI